MCAGSWGDCLGLKAQPSLELFLNLGLWESGSHQKIMRKSESVGLTLQCSVPPRLDNALGSPCWKWFKTESWTNLKGSLNTRITQVLVYELGFVKDVGSPVSWVSESFCLIHMRVCQETSKSRQQKYSHIMWVSFRKVKAEHQSVRWNAWVVHWW